MGASGTGGTVVMLLASKEYGEKKKRFRGMQDDYRLRPNVWCSSIAINFSARHLQTLSLLAAINL